MKLAIVIPAYKYQYLEAALTSISKQTDKNFTVYIGDDNSPHNLFEIVTRFTDKINIVYHKYDTNAGSIDLTDHWNRCIFMTKDEEWIWLFSDDDLMDENCVSRFNEALTTTNSAYDLYRFNTQIINADGEVIAKNQPHPQVETSLQFAFDRLKLNRNSYVVEYIFSKQRFIETGKFVSFPLAWSSDEATWVNIGFEKGIFTISDAYVYWRYSFTNISSVPGFFSEKIEATLQYLSWLNNKIKTLPLKDERLTGEFENLKFNWLKHQLRLFNRKFGIVESYNYSKLFVQRLSIPAATSYSFFFRHNFEFRKYVLKRTLVKYLKSPR